VTHMVPPIVAFAALLLESPFAKACTRGVEPPSSPLRGRAAVEKR